MDILVEGVGLTMRCYLCEGRDALRACVVLRDGVDVKRRGWC